MKCGFIVAWPAFLKCAPFHVFISICIFLETTAKPFVHFKIWLLLCSVELYIVLRLSPGFFPVLQTEPRVSCMLCVCYSLSYSFQNATCMHFLSFWFVFSIVVLAWCHDEMSDKSHLRTKVCFGSHFRGHSPSVEESMVAGAWDWLSYYICYQEAERRMPVVSLLAPFYSGWGLSPWVDATCIQGPSSAGRPLWKYPHSHVQKFVFMVIFHLRLAQWIITPLLSKFSNLIAQFIFLLLLVFLMS